MKRLLLIAVALIGLTGCGPDKRDIAQAQANQMADTWDGGPKFTAEGADPWGEPYSSKVDKGPVSYTLTVRSNAPDRLPQTRDDIVAARSHKHTPVSAAAAPGVERFSEALGKGVGRGGVAGIKEGWFGKKGTGRKRGSSGFPVGDL